MSTGAAADTMLPRHSMQLPSPEWSLCCCEADSRWCVQPSGQQIPSIAFRDANTTSIATARNLRTIRLCLLPGRIAPGPTISWFRVLAAYPKDDDARSDQRNACADDVPTVGPRALDGLEPVQESSLTTTSQVIY